MKGYMDTREAAEKWGRDVEMLRRFLKRGLVPGAERNGPRGHWRIPADGSPPATLPDRRHKLTEDERREVARLGHAGANRTELAKRYGIQRLHVYHLMGKYPPGESA